MGNVSKWLGLSVERDPLDSKCDFGQYKGWYWKTICEKDPDYILWLITESRVLLPRKLEKSIMGFLKNLTQG